jgi:membrane-bound lytic murein transglycosylase F
LLAAVDAFLGDPERASDRATIARRYFRPTARSPSPGRTLGKDAGRISRFDADVRRWSERYGFDWRLISAQIFQESRFDPEARSPAGAFGLMQLMPATADHMDVPDWRAPAGNIQAGTKYLAWVRDRFEGSLPAVERTLMALAAYNAGTGHVVDARQLARERGLDPDRWAGNVEEAMLLKLDPEVHRNTRFGYCRCTEPVEYVRRIRSLYKSYVQALPLDPDGR